MPKTSRQNIEAIADKCGVSRIPFTNTAYTVRYGRFTAIYDISADRPRYIPPILSGVTIATNQYVIDGMRLAAQRVIDKRKGENFAASFAATMESLLSTPSIGASAFDKIFAGFQIPPKIAVDPAKPGSDRTFIWHIGADMGKSLVPDLISLKIKAMAIMSFEQLAAEYKAAKDSRVKALNGSGEAFDQEVYDRMEKVMDLADDIACARFGVGFYSPNGK